MNKKGLKVIEMFAKRGRKAIRKPLQGALPKQITSLVSSLLVTVKKIPFNRTS